MANSSDVIAVCTGYGCGMSLVSTHSGAVVNDSLKGTHVAILDKHRVVGVLFNEEICEWKLLEFTDNTLTKEVLFEDVSLIESVKASANGKRLYVGDGFNPQLLEYRTANWSLSARIVLSGAPVGQCAIAANGLLAQGIWREDGDLYCIDLIEANCRCVTQTIRTKHTLNITEVAFSPDSNRIVSVSKGKSVQVFDAITGQMIGEPRVAHSGCVHSICWLTDAWFVTVSTDMSLVVWHCDSQPPIARIQDAHSHSRIQSVLCLATDSFVTGAIDGSVIRWKFDCESAAV